MTSSPLDTKYTPLHFSEMLDNPPPDERTAAQPAAQTNANRDISGNWCCEHEKEADRLRADVQHWKDARQAALDSGDILKEELERLRQELADRISQAAQLTWDLTDCRKRKDAAEAELAGMISNAIIYRRRIREVETELATARKDASLMLGLVVLGAGGSVWVTRKNMIGDAPTLQREEVDGDVHFTAIRALKAKP